MKIDITAIPVYYINLEREVEKRQRTEQLLQNMGFRNVIRVPAIEHEAGRIVGCARSHRNILNNIKAPAIILEDDCEINKEFDGTIDIPENADAVYLGISHWGRYLNHSGPFVHTLKTETDCVRVFNMLATHAILYLNDDYIKMCSRIAYHFGYEVKNHVDIGIAEIQKYFNVYALDIPLFRQYEWSAVTTGRLSENSIDACNSDELFIQVLMDDSNFYKLNQEFKSPFRPLISRRDVNGVPGYFVPTKLI